MLQQGLVAVGTRIGEASRRTTCSEVLVQMNAEYEITIIYQLCQLECIINTHVLSLMQLYLAAMC